jgi:prepilin-type N-terminal cleavage/methylation domain-containing protein
MIYSTAFKERAMRTKLDQKGFTLVEIAIVLVIIGLLLGGILKGQEMITQAKIKNVIADMSGVSAAMYGYQDRYKALPGDDKKADRWSTTGVANGDGDGIIEVKYLASSGESVQFWLHLRSAGFISGTGLEQPFNAVAGKMGVQTGDGTADKPGAVLATTGTPATPGFTNLMLCSANLPDKIAISVDSQMDDGDAKTGNVRSQKQSQPNPADINATSDAYSEDGVSSYTACRQM